ncbi:sigma factor-like helix-turn-helix DNA-binding protein, partial [Sulfoacidibacillus thermotolerans]
EAVDAMEDLAVQYVQTRQQLLLLRAQNQSQERIFWAEIRALVIHLPPWAQAYFEDASKLASEKDWTHIVERMVYALKDEQEYHAATEIEQRLRKVSELRNDRSKLESMVRDRTLDLYEMQRYAELPDDVTREAKQILNKHKTSFVDYKDALRNQTTDPIETFFDDKPEDQEDAGFHVGFSQLSKRQKEAYYLHKVENLSYAKIAELFGVKKGSIERYIEMARKKLERPSAQLEIENLSYEKIVEGLGEKRNVPRGIECEKECSSVQLELDFE